MEHNAVISFFLALAVIIMAARLFGTLSRNLGQPRVLGELIAGIVLGPTLLNMPHWGIFHHAELGELIIPFAELGVLFLMFIIGLEVNITDLLKVGYVAILAGILGVLIPVAMTIPAGMAFDYPLGVSLFAGVTLAATSVSISAQVLLELGVLQSKEGNALLATAIIDDILAILLVSVAIALIGGANTSEADAVGITTILVIIGRMVGYIGIALMVSWVALPKIITWVDAHPRLGQSYGIATLSIMFMLLFAWSADVFGGVATITGAFIAGIGIGRVQETLKHDIENTVNRVAFAFLMPIFFVSVGLETDLRSFPVTAIPLMLVLLTVAIISKIGGSGIGARLAGFNNQEALRVGICMISRGEVGLIIASLGLTSGILVESDPMFSSLFLVIILTTLITPILVRQVFPKQEQKGALS